MEPIARAWVRPSERAVLGDAEAVLAGCVWVLVCHNTSRGGGDDVVGVFTSPYVAVGWIKDRETWDTDWHDVAYAWPVDKTNDIFPVTHNELLYENGNLVRPLTFHPDSRTPNGQKVVPERVGGDA